MARSRLRDFCQDRTWSQKGEPASSPKKGEWIGADQFRLPPSFSGWFVFHSNTGVAQRPVAQAISSGKVIGLDQKRLKELEELTGLSLEPDERETLKTDLDCLERFAASLPAGPFGSQDMALLEQRDPEPTEVASLDRKVFWENTPVARGGFINIPATERKKKDPS